MSRYYDYDNEWPPYVTVAERRRKAAKKIASMRKAGRTVAPIEIAGRKIATTFWGEAWCKNLEAYSDFANRLPRGRTYVRHGSVLDLQIGAGRVRTLVSGTELYTVDITIKPLGKKSWTQIKARCAGQIDSLVELLQGSISRNVMEIVTRKGEGLFPSPREIALGCSCPDWAAMCKHVAATLYGVGARLDHEPELLFTLRGVDPAEMIEAAVDQPAGNGKRRKGRVLAADQLPSVFGVDIDMDGVDMGGVSPSEAFAPADKTRTADGTQKTRKPAAAGASKKAGARTAGTAKTEKTAKSEKKAKKVGRRKSKASASSTNRAPAKKRAVKKATAKRKPSRR
jgi:uncharacterized Zn finger protein